MKSFARKGFPMLVPMILSRKIASILNFGTATDQRSTVDPSNISISSATLADIPGMCAVTDAFWRSDPFYLALASEEPGDLFFRYQRELCQLSLGHDMKRAHVCILVAKITRTGEVVGYFRIHEKAGKHDMEREAPRPQGSLPFGDVTNRRIPRFEPSGPRLASCTANTWLAHTFV